VPTYQYSCTECGHFFEQFQSFSEDSLTVCPQCQGRLRKVFNAVGVVFKGSGFYRTDSRTDSRSGGSGGSGDSGSGSGSSDGTSGEKKSGSGDKAASGSSSSGSSGGAKASSGSSTSAA
jgi:putative FmdB family regulatory protein